ncbi:hypothetical protein GCM10022247_10200 [Allokutzneria multivorans]|uniref:Uncharacterized protein n=1 Tax=Allokutzneria multivorans TaxID=1142134 RepID=A0ABP7R5J4_9PSEU
MVGGTIRRWWWEAQGWQRLGAAVAGTALGLSALGGTSALLRPNPTAVPAALTVVQSSTSVAPTTTSAPAPVETTTEAPPPPPTTTVAPTKKPTQPPRTHTPAPKPTTTEKPALPKAGGACAKQGDFAISDQGKALLCMKDPGDQRLKWRQL